MWLAERMKKTSSGGYADVGVVSTGGASPTVISATERGSFELLCPAGIVRLPADGERYLTLDCADGTRTLIGTLAEEVPDDLCDGEIYIATDAASVCVRNDGSIELRGSVSIVGTLTVNGETIASDDTLDE